MLSNTQPFVDELERALPSRPFAVEFWDGTRIASTNGGGPTFSVRSPEALAHALRAPGQLGLGRAYVSGELAVDDLDEVLELLDSWEPPPLDRRAQARLAVAAVRATGLVRPPAVPRTELRPRGRRHSPERDARSVRHHYDVSNDFFRLMLGESMTYSCALFSRGATTLEEAQEAKLELVCTKLALEPRPARARHRLRLGQLRPPRRGEPRRARNGHHALGAAGRRSRAERAEERGLADRVDIRVMDYRDLGGEPFDAVASIGMVEHVGSAQIDVYARQVARLVKPGGRVLNHGIARLRVGDPEAGPFSERYVFPDAAPLHLSRIQLALERAGLETEHVEGLRMDYAETLKHWAANIDDNLDEATRLAGPERIRVWRLYLRAARRGFESGFTSIYQVRGSRPAAS